MNWIFPRSEAALLRAAMACGLSESEARPTIKSGISKGMAEPRTPPNNGFQSNHGRREPIRTEPPRPDEWETPISLEAPRPPAMPENLIPGPVGDMARAVAAFTETPLELPVGMGLGAVAACASKKYMVQVKPGYSEPVNAMAAAILETGNRKSAVEEKIFAPILQVGGGSI